MTREDSPTEPLPTLRLQERRSRLCRLAPDEVRYLLARHRSVLDLVPTERRQVWRVTPRGVIGALLTPRRRMVIEAKIPIGTLLEPFQAVVGAGGMVEGPVDPLDLLGRELAERMSERVAVGLQRGYREETRQGRYLVGRLDVAEQLRRSRHQRDQFHTRGDAFTVDLTCNQVPRAIAECLVGSGMLSGETRARLRQALQGYAGVSPVALSEPLLEALRREVVPVGHGPLLELCLWWVTAMGPGAATPTALLLSLERWFERRVERIAVAACGGEVRCQRSQVVGHPGVELRPDICVERQGRVKVLVDAKWKRGGLVREDLYQMVSYAALLGGKEAVVVYPGCGREQVLELPSVRLHVCRLNVRGAVQEQARSARRLGRVLRRLSE